MHELAIYPGTFDPITLGHVDLVRRAAVIFPRLIVAISSNLRKSPCFTLNERLDMARELAAEFPNVMVESFDGLLVDYANSRGCRILVRGIRAFSDFEFEFQMALTNRKLAPEIETVFLMPQEMYSVLSSSVVREIASLGGDTSELVPAYVQKALEQKRRSGRPP